MKGGFILHDNLLKIFNSHPYREQDENYQLHRNILLVRNILELDPDVSHMTHMNMNHNANMEYIIMFVIVQFDHILLNLYLLEGMILISLIREKFIMGVPNL